MIGKNNEKVIAEKVDPEQSAWNPEDLISDPHFDDGLNVNSSNIRDIMNRTFALLNGDEAEFKRLDQKLKSKDAKVIEAEVRHLPAPDDSK